MANFLAEYGLFLAKIITVIGGVFLLIAGVYSTSQRYRKMEKDGHIQVTSLNDRFKDMAFAVKSGVLSDAAYSELCKQEKKEQKARDKQDKKQAREVAAGAELRPRVFVVDFHGDIRASATHALTESITAILSQATVADEVVVRLESAGGLVHAYGLAASQLQRVRDKQILLTICVDKVAASGGYMMACVANKILSAPFAVIGSIGVVAQLPNLNRLLRKHDIDYEMLTAGEYKRTLTVFGENTDKGRQKFQEEIDATHLLFKAFIAEHRPALDINAVATGEVWFGSKALEQGLVDGIQTSDAYLYERHLSADVYRIEWIEKRSLAEKLGIASEQAAERIMWRLIGQSGRRDTFY